MAKLVLRDRAQKKQKKYKTYTNDKEFLDNFNEKNIYAGIISKRIVILKREFYEGNKWEFLPLKARDITRANSFLVNQNIGSPRDENINRLIYFVFENVTLQSNKIYEFYTLLDFLEWAINIEKKLTGIR